MPSIAASPTRLDGLFYVQDGINRVAASLLCGFTQIRRRRCGRIPAHRGDHRHPRNFSMRE
jgi:hypothetical protein